MCLRVAVLGQLLVVRAVTRAAFRYNGFDRFAHIAVRLVYIGATAPGAEPIVTCALLALVRWTRRLVHTLTQNRILWSCLLDLLCCPEGLVACNKSEYCLDRIVLERKLPSGQAWFKAQQVNRDMSWLIFATLPPCINYLRRCC